VFGVSLILPDEPKSFCLESIFNEKLLKSKLLENIMKPGRSVRYKRGSSASKNESLLPY
jgi:hypothetical protein